MSGPERIVCLTEETTEWLYLLGEERRIVGISGYTVRPKRARQDKPRVSAFLDGKVDKIAQLKPELVIGWIAACQQRHREIAHAAAAWPRRPRVYFEEWDEPMISAIRWVSELVTLAGGDDIFPELAAQSLGRDRVIADPLEPARRAPDVIIGSWCGKKFRPEKVAARAGWQDVPAVRAGRLHEIKSCDILQPGPAALTDGLEQLHRLCAGWADAQR
jgi:iron complex transport system substrate-binding protein